MTDRVRITRLGAGGDGIGQTQGGPVYVPFTLPQEVATIARMGKRGMLVALIEASPDRVAPACRHFGTCGGCALQHMAGQAYRAWKKGLVVDALRARGLDCAVQDLVACRPGTRRRAVFSAGAGDKGLGF